MSYADSVLVARERVLYRGRIHWAIYLLEIVVALSGISWVLAFKQAPVADQVMFATAINRPYLILPAYIIIGAALLGLLRDIIRKATTELVITNCRVLAKFGIIRRVTYEILLSKVEGANISVTILGRILGYGSIEVKGIGGRTAPINYIAQPYVFQQHLMDLILADDSEEEEEEHYRQIRAAS